MVEKTIKRNQSSAPSTTGKLYLIAYNCIQTLGWSYMFWQLVVHFLNRGTLDTFWAEIKWTVVIFQNAAILEILHAAIGLVPSGVVLVFMQVQSRVFVVCATFLATQGASTSPGLPICILAWSVTEIIRYAYYAANLIGCTPRILLFMRYSTFLVMYPIGITGELLCMYHALPEVLEKKLFTVSMPNEWNFVFNFYYFLMFYMFLYLPFFPVLFGHMMSQRRKMLSKEPKKTK